MKNGLVLALAILGGFYFLSYFGFRSWALCPGWGWKSSYFNNFGIWPGHPFFWVDVPGCPGVCRSCVFFAPQGNPGPQSLSRGRIKNEERIWKGIKRYASLVIIVFLRETYNGKIQAHNLHKKRRNHEKIIYHDHSTFDCNPWFVRRILCATRCDEMAGKRGMGHGNALSEDV